MKLKPIFKSAPQILDIEYDGLKRVISGGQTGADQAGLFAAEAFSLETGGHMPAGFKTVHGDRVEFGTRFGMLTTPSSQYPDRTLLNVQNSDATIRLASDFTTPGERLTLRFVNMMSKPSMSIQLVPAPDDFLIERLIAFLINHNVQTLNVAGNADRGIKTYHFDTAFQFLSAVFKRMDLRGHLIKKQIQ
jgi:hypothetical protein